MRCSIPGGIFLFVWTPGIPSREEDNKKCPIFDATHCLVSASPFSLINPIKPTKGAALVLYLWSQS